MQICYDYQVFAAQKYGGISRYFTEIAWRIQLFPDTGVRVIAPLYRSKYLEEKRSLIPITGRYFAKDFARATGFCLRVDSILSKLVTASYHPDIVHETFYSVAPTVKTSRKIVSTVHDLIAEIFPDPPSRLAEVKRTRKLAFDRADHLICISHNTRADLTRLYDIDPAKVSVIHLASSLAPSSKPPLQRDEPYFLFVGGRWGYKNFLGLAHAYRESGLLKSHKLVCFAADTFAPHELQRIHELGIPLDRFEIIDGDDDLLARYYASAVALVYPSLYEGFGIPLLEAMECSCPVLCGTAGSIPEVVGDAALFFDASDPHSIAQAMATIANSPDERLRLIQKGRERVRQFSWDRCAEQTFAVYKKVLSGK